jgi:hypothetical protein
MRTHHRGTATASDRLKNAHTQARICSLLAAVPERQQACVFSPLSSLVRLPIRPTCPTSSALRTVAAHSRGVRAACRDHCAGRGAGERAPGRFRSTAASSFFPPPRLLSAASLPRRRHRVSQQLLFVRERCATNQSQRQRRQQIETTEAQEAREDDSTMCSPSRWLPLMRTTALAVISRQVDLLHVVRLTAACSSPSNLHREAHSEAEGTDGRGHTWRDVPSCVRCVRVLALLHSRHTVLAVAERGRNGQSDTRISLHSHAGGRRRNHAASLWSPLAMMQTETGWCILRWAP